MGFSLVGQQPQSERGAHEAAVNPDKRYRHRTKKFRVKAEQDADVLMSCTTNPAFRQPQGQ